MPPDSLTNPIPRRAFGASGETVSALGLGGYHIGSQATAAESIRIIRTAIDAGVDFLDNCWDYNGGQSEERMGQALADGYRQRAFLMTKLDGRSDRVATEQLDQSLERLRTDVVDLVQIHEVIYEDDAEKAFRDDGIIAALERAKKQGKLRYIGFTGHKSPALHLSMLAEADKHGFVFDAVQMPLNVLDHHYDSFEKLVLPVLVDKGIAVLGMKSNAAGEIAKSGAATPEECLRYALGLPTSVVISGMDSLEVLEANLAIARDTVPLSEPARTALLARTLPYAHGGQFEPFKSTGNFDGTAMNPHWLTEARL